jgi:hypothetical protein
MTNHIELFERLWGEAVRILGGDPESVNFRENGSAGNSHYLPVQKRINLNSRCGASSDPKFTKDPILDSIVLSHEAGHALSDVNGLRTEEVNLAYRDHEHPWFTGGEGVTALQRKLIIREEVRAWRYGRMMLRKLGFQDWKAFREYSRKCLRSYLAHVKTRPADA